MAGKKKTKNVDLTTGIGTISFPRVFASTKGKKESDGSDQYDIQFIIPKSQRADCKAILDAIKEVGIDAFGDPEWREHRIPLRDGDKEAKRLASDGQTNGEKYPERLGCYFINARSGKPVGVYDRQKNLIDNPDDLYGGCKGKIAVSFYAYNTNGNVGVGCSLNGVQKMAEGEAFGGGKPSVDAMFNLEDEPDDDGLDTGEAEPEPTPPPAKKAAAKKAAAPKVAEPDPEPDVDTDEDLLGDADDSGSILDDLDD